VNISYELLAHAVLAGILLGGFYAAVSIGLAISFGYLNVPQVAHPTFLVMGGFGAVILNRYGFDPILGGLLTMPVFFAFGWAVYTFYHHSFERRGEDADLRGIAFFFGLSLVLEITLSLMFGVDQQIVSAPYIGRSIALGDFRIPYRTLIACGGALLISGLFVALLRKTFTGRAIQAVAQDETALLIVGADPVRIKQIAFAFATATTSLSGALLAIIGPVTPGLGRLYLGKVFAIVVLAGLGSIRGVILASLVLGVTESLLLATAGTSWTPAVAFGIILVTLAVKPNGLFGR
jgi:branched-chain amino acid transport system permease protein